MIAQVCQVGIIQLVIYHDVWDKMQAQQRRFPFLPTSPQALYHDLRQLSMGIPTLVEVGKGQHAGEAELVLHTKRYYLKLVPTRAYDAYRVIWIEPLDLSQHDKLARGALLLRVPDWRVWMSPRDIQRGANSYLQQIVGHWNYLQTRLQTATPPTYTLSSAQKEYLRVLESLIETTRRLVLDTTPPLPPLGYRKVEAAGEERENLRDVYTFHVTTGSQLPEQGMFARLRDAPDLRGRVFAVKKGQVTIKFESGTGIDLARIPPQGVLEVLPASETAFKIQRQALEKLSAGEALNPHLLKVLVDHQFHSFHPANVLPPPEVTLNPAQLDAFRRAVAVPDLLLVLGPPGTGKTQTITEISRNLALGQRGRVLVTSRTHKAVDNVLERLPEHLTLIRIGHEDKISEQARAFLIDRQAQKLQGTILAKTEALASRLAQLEPQAPLISHKAEELEGCIKRLKETSARQHYAASVAPLSQQIQQLEQRIQAANAKSSRLLIGIIWRLRGRSLRGQVRKYEAEMARQRAAYEAAVQAIQPGQPKPVVDLQHQGYDAWKEQEARAAQEGRHYLQHAQQLVETLRQMLAGALTLPFPQEWTTPALEYWLGQFRQAHQMCMNRFRLMQAWRARLALPNQQFYPVLLRFADVVGATCIGIATRADFRELDFDLAIVDEAGQIGLADLLVPLVRARRAILVGDHQQLPPFVDQEVQDWLRQLSEDDLQEIGLAEVGEEALKEVLTKSAFELLFAHTHPEHLVRLTEQYRMPQAVADFASRQFYEGRLTTRGNTKVSGAPHHDPIFPRPLVFVDTSRLPEGHRYEQRASRAEAGLGQISQPGYINTAEADLLVQIASFYHHDQPDTADWVVIVPYQAQARYIREALRRQLPDLDHLEERISTVDAFQGGERKRILYSFTRSNARREVGFLRELRRLNVAITRAQEQLVLVGDANFLTHVDDSGFRNLMVRLVEHVQREGLWLPYEACQALLQQKGGR